MGRPLRDEWIFIFPADSGEKGRKMKNWHLLGCGMAAMLLAGCMNTYNSTGPQAGPAAGNNLRIESRGAKQMVVNVNPGMTQPQPVTFTPVSYQEIYTTEYTACGPVVKKAIVPIYGPATPSTMPVSCNPGVMNGFPGTQMGQPVQFQPCTSYVPVIPNCPPAQPVVPSIAEPVAWYGPSATPNYSTQTNWY